MRVIGLGQTGAAVCDQLVLHGRPSQDLWVFDSDQLTIEGSVVPNRHLLGHSLVHGLGCSGDIALARELLGWSPEVSLREGLGRTIEQSGARLLQCGDCSTGRSCRMK